MPSADTLFGIIVAIMGLAVLVVIWSMLTSKLPTPPSKREGRKPFQLRDPRKQSPFNSCNGCAACDPEDDQEPCKEKPRVCATHHKENCEECFGPIE